MMVFQKYFDVLGLQNRTLYGVPYSKSTLYRRQQYCTVRNLILCTLLDPALSVLEAESIKTFSKNHRDLLNFQYLLMI